MRELKFSGISTGHSPATRLYQRSHLSPDWQNRAGKANEQVNKLIQVMRYVYPALFQSGLKDYVVAGQRAGM